MKNLCLRLSLALVALTLTAAARGVNIPTASGTALDGHAVLLPRDLSPRATILILGFTKDSQQPTTAWEKATRASLNAPGIAYFDLPFLEDAPTLIRPFILRTIRKQVPDIVKSHYVPLTSGQSAWKQTVGYTPNAPDAAYVLLVDRSGTILWQTHEPYSPALFDQLSHATKQLAAEAF